MDNQGGIGILINLAILTTLRTEIQGFMGGKHISVYELANLSA